MVDHHPSYCALPVSFPTCGVGAASEVSNLSGLDDTHLQETGRHLFVHFTLVSTIVSLQSWLRLLLRNTSYAYWRGRTPHKCHFACRKRLDARCLRDFTNWVVLTYEPALRAASRSALSPATGPLRGGRVDILTSPEFQR